MTYPVVPSFFDPGARVGPATALLIHLAEGGGTVGYLSRDNPNGVSVHFVIERSGRIVQMLGLDRASGSVNPRDIRTTDDADGFYGATAARAVIGDRNPNHACISVEVEGFAIEGPNAAQHAALRAWAADMRRLAPTLKGALGHRDFADYKACPGRKVDWSTVGGHGLWEPEEMIHATVRERWRPTVTNGRSNGVLRAAPDRSSPILARLSADTEIVTCAEVRTPGFQRGGDDHDWRVLETRDKAEPRYLLRADLESLGLVAADCSAQVAAAVKPLNDKIAAAKAALG